MSERIPQSVTKRVPLKAYLTGTTTPATGKTIAITISKNGGAYANPSAGATNATEISNGSYYVDLSTTDTGTLGPLMVLGAVSGIDDIDAIYTVADPHNGGFDGVPSATAAASGGLPTVGSGSGQLNPSGGKLPATLAASDVTGNVPGDLQTIKTQTVACAAGVTVGAFVGNATHAITVDSSGDVTFNNTSIATVTTVGSVTGNVGGIAGTITTLDALADHGDSAWATATGFATAAVWTNALAASLGTLASHDPGATLGTSTLTQTQVTGGAYALNSASFSFNAALDFTSTQKTSLGSTVVAGIAGATQTLDALQTSLSFAHGGGSWTTATGFAVAGDAMTLTSGAYSAVADTTLRRGMAAVEGSSSGDALSLSSLYGMVQQAQESDTTTAAGKLTIYKTNGTTVLGSTTLSSDSGAAPITGNKLT